MDERRKSGGVGVLVAIVLCLLLVALYVVGYFGLGHYEQTAIGVQRAYPHPLVARLYCPMAWVEAKVTDQPVVLVGGEYEPAFVGRP
jgi:hypothetical protein